MRARPPPVRRPGPIERNAEIVRPGCTRKRRHGTWEGAKIHADRLSDAAHVYHCRWCDGYHVTRTKIEPRP